MNDLNLESNKKIRNKNMPLAMIFNDYYYIFGQNKATRIPESSIKNEVVIDLMKIIKSIHFTVKLSSLPLREFHR